MAENERFNQFVKKELADFERCHFGVDAYIIQKYSCPQCGHGLDYRGYTHQVNKTSYLIFMVCNECEFWEKV